MNFNKVTLTNFIQLTDKEKIMILKWRNYNVIRQWMYDTNIISLENHFNFIKSLEKDKTKKYFLVLNDNEYIGVINFTNIDYDKRKSDFGIYANPNIKKAGKVLMEIICNYGFVKLKMKKLNAEVFNDNIKAIHLYNRFNFVEFNHKIVNDKKIICMELKNENR